MNIKKVDDKPMVIHTKEDFKRFVFGIETVKLRQAIKTMKTPLLFSVTALLFSLYF